MGTHNFFSGIVEMTSFSAVAPPIATDMPAPATHAPRSLSSALKTVGVARAPTIPSVFYSPSR